jgi:predicted GNAT family N-acyltransferase
MDETLDIDVVSWSLEGDTLRRIRDQVFTEEQGVPPEIEQDGHDATATHFLVTQAGAPLACGRLLPDGKVGRMAVLQAHRRRGVGAKLLDAIVRHAYGNGVLRLYLHAQRQAADFYRRAGFEAFGEEFEEAGIPHVAMSLELDYREADSFITGVDFPEPFATLAVALSEGARRHLRIYSHRLDHKVFDNPELASALTRLVRRGRQSDIRILVNDAKPMTSRGHRLLELSRRLSSSISIRVLDEHPELPEATFVVRDNDGILYKPDERGANGFYEPASRASAKRFVTSFDALWRWGQNDPSLRRLTM